MTAAAEVDDAWMEKCLIAISPEGGSDIQFAALTETVDFDIGEKGIEGIPLVNGGRVTKFNPEGDTTVTFEAYPLEVGTDTGTTGKGFFDMMHTVDATQPQRITNDHTRTKHRILVLWTNATDMTTAQATTTATYSGLRIGMAEAYITSVKSSFTDRMNKFTITAKCAAFDKAADGNVMMESTNGADTTPVSPLPAIASYTSSAKFA